MLLIKGVDTKKYKKEMEAVYRLRHEVFVEEQGWEAIRKPNCLETDQFDTEDALHFLLYEDDELIGYQRLLPTTKPYLLSEIYPELCDGPVPRSENTWEWTRFAVRKDKRKGKQPIGLAGNVLLSALVDWGLEHDVRKIVIESRPLWLHSLVRLHFRPNPIGVTADIGGSETLAVVASFDERTQQRLAQFRDQMTLANKQRA